MSKESESSLFFMDENMFIIVSLNKMAILNDEEPMEDSEMSYQIKAHDLNLILGHTWEKEKTDSQKLSLTLHITHIVAHTNQ